MRRFARLDIGTRWEERKKLRCCMLVDEKKTRGMRNALLMEDPFHPSPALTYLPNTAASCPTRASTGLWGCFPTRLHQISMLTVKPPSEIRQGTALRKRVA